MQTKKSPRKKLGSRERLLAGADRLFRRSGYAGTALSDITAQGRAPMGSVYFHFPRGKEQLAAEAMHYGSQSVLRGLRQALESSPDPAQGLAKCARAWADDLEESNWEEGCPVASTALQTCATSEPLRLASAEIIRTWTDVIANHLEVSGCTKEEASVVADLALSLLEGAELLARVQRNRAPLDRAAVAMRALLPPRLINKKKERR